MNNLTLCSINAIPARNKQNGISVKINIIFLVVLENSEFFLLSLMLVLLWGGVLLLFTFLTTTTKAQDQVEGRFLNDDLNN